MCLIDVFVNKRVKCNVYVYIHTEVRNTTQKISPISQQTVAKRKVSGQSDDSGEVDGDEEEQS